MPENYSRLHGTAAEDQAVDSSQPPSGPEKANPPPVFTSFDIHLFHEGKHRHLYQKLGSHIAEVNGEKGVHFAVWAPNAEAVHVVGDFNGWNSESHALAPIENSGIWAGFIPGIGQGCLYKYHIASKFGGYWAEKGDPFALRWETPPRTASVVWEISEKWTDHEWLAKRKSADHHRSPMSIYEMHLGSWKRNPEEGNRFLTYLELAEQLPAYLLELGFTHVEFLPVMEHPFYGSWGYQTIGYFAPTSRYGTPEEFMFLVDSLHRAGIGVILDWVPSHFPGDLHGLHFFDGTHLYEHEDPRRGYHPDWKSHIFDYGRNEVRSFLISNAIFWLEKFHIDGLRVDAVASMLYLDYSRAPGEWEPNVHGGRENLEAIGFLKEFNTAVYGLFPDIVTIAEESTAWPAVSRPVHTGGLGFGMKWMMGWMHDTLNYFKRDPIHRRHHHHEITFSAAYAFSENFVLPFSHDEVVYGKGSLIGRMPGDEESKFAHIRALYAYMFAHPGAKLLFMGNEFAQYEEWNHDLSLDWHLTDRPRHRDVQGLISELNRLYRREKALHEGQFESWGFKWIDKDDADNGVLAFMRHSAHRREHILVVCNFTPVHRRGHRLGVPHSGAWELIFRSDENRPGGNPQTEKTIVTTQPTPWHGQAHALEFDLPALGVLYFKHRG